MKKKIISAIFAVIMCISLSVTAFAYDLFYDTYKKAAEALHEKYPDISVDEFMDEFSQFLNEPLDQEKINEAIQNLVNRLTPTTDPNETTTKKTPSTTKEHTTKAPTTKREENTTSAPSFTIPSGLINNNNNNNNGTTSANVAGGITIPQITENSSLTQSVPVVSMYQQNSPNIDNNKNTPAASVDDKSTVSSKTIMAWVIIAIGVMLLVVSIVVIAMSSDRRAAQTRRNRKRMRKNGEVRKDYVPFTETSMPEVTVNTAADLAKKKHLASSADEANAIYDKATASALDSAVIIAAESGSTYDPDSAPDVDTSVAENILKKSAKTVRVCEDCGTTVPQDMMFCPKCGTFMGIIDASPDTSNSVRNDSDNVDLNESGAPLTGKGTPVTT